MLQGFYGTVLQSCVHVHLHSSHTIRHCTFMQVTWKADGTRYMLLLCKWGVYVIDRSFRIRRVQMRCIVPGCAWSLLDELTFCRPCNCPP
jgi:mRNA capping enzyme, catalytic domain